MEAGGFPILYTLVKDKENYLYNEHHLYTYYSAFKVFFKKINLCKENNSMFHGKL